MPGANSKRFECQFPGCSSSYQRKEHLHRHEAQHRGPLAHPCPFCKRTFARNDTLRRHVSRDHAESQLASARTSQACENCRVAKARCRGGSPCTRCEGKGRQCIFSNPAPSQPDAGREQLTEPDRVEDVDMNLGPVFPDTNPADKAQHCVHLYFAHFHRHWPILHQGTFDIAHEPPFLVQAVMMVGLWASGSASAQRAAIELHSRLGPSIQEQRSNWDKTFQEEQGESYNTPASRWPIATYQGILLYIIFSLISSKARCNSLDLTLSMAPSDRDILSDLCETCLRNNIFYYPRMLERYRDLDSITCIWVGVEEIKRLGLALYKVSRLCGDRLIGLPDLQFPIPDSRHLWNAQSNPELSRLLQIEADRGKRLDGSQEGNWISSYGEWLDGSMEVQWI